MFKRTVLTDKDGKPLSRSEGEAVMKGRGAIAIATYALLLSIGSILSNTNSGRVLNATLEINDTWAFYQAKSIKQAIAQASVDEIDIFLLGTGISPEAKTFAEERARRHKTNVARYETDPAAGDGKKELAVKANALQREREEAKSRSFYYSLSTALLQIGIVLSSTSILAISMEMLYVSIGFACAGVTLMANGYWGLF